ncbi:MAG: hypothetical protein ACT6SF_19990 [Hydrogenophaga sp.]|jgi:hypothetical protein|uniref:hypothetical protein n=1 Tax=Hydrogenophaga sp. TaxID=1904254 RepID=UPI001D628F96|nr:hypothetical protein [Hydrogenophaga sp.]MBW0168717.1 hypothetical protein [Hydrogenophaga sp.]MBW0186077.1 hypothetical protein [Hydrogenophaga sp.]
MSADKVALRDHAAPIRANGCTPVNPVFYWMGSLIHQYEGHFAQSLFSFAPDENNAPPPEIQRN